MAMGSTGEAKMRQDSRHKELMIAWLNGAPVEFLKHAGAWELLDNNTADFHNHMEYRLQPAATAIDLKRLIVSGIDCEFSDHEDFSSKAYAPLELIDPSAPYPYKSVLGHVYERARPRMNHWHHWQGSVKPPLPAGIVVKWLLRGEQDTVPASVEDLNWGYINDEYSSGNIIAFKVIGLAEGYKWPWE
jgi:hypothetical protein